MLRPGLFTALALLAGSCQEKPLETPEKLKFERVTDDEIEHGKRVAAILGCTGCHGENFAGTDWSDPELGVLWTANLTRSAAKHSDEEMLAMITTGKRPDRALMDMPSHLFTQVHEDDLRAVLAYLRSMPLNGEEHPAPTIGPKLAGQIAAGDYLDSAQEARRDRNVWPSDMGPQHAMGRHIVRATCAECHQFDLRGEDPPTSDEPRSADLRIVASYDPQDFAKLMRTGKAAGDREVGLMSEVARGRFVYFTDEEVEMIRSYLVEVGRRDP